MTASLYHSGSAVGIPISASPAGSRAEASSGGVIGEDRQETAAKGLQYRGNFVFRRCSGGEKTAPSYDSTKRLAFGWEFCPARIDRDWSRPCRSNESLWRVQLFPRILDHRD